jgi:F-type H+-transporting ATPase subunit epsilon
MDPKQTINITVLSPEETLFSGKATALTCHNLDGEFDILPSHSNFISLVDEYVIIHTIDGKQKKITIAKALLKALGDEIIILLNVDLTERDLIFKALFKQIEEKAAGFVEKITK